MSTQNTRVQEQLSKQPKVSLFTPFELLNLVRLFQTGVVQSYIAVVDL